MESETETPVFDTEGYIKRLTDAGMPEAQARIVAEQQARVHKRFHEMGQKLIIKFGAFVVIGIIVLSVLDKLL